MSSNDKKSNPYLIYALDINGKPVHIDSVPNGFSCNCKCPHCSGKLQAKNGGTERAHHFAHNDGADCKGAVESAIHCLAKEILKESLCVMLPKNAGELQFNKVETEKNFPELKLRPDCVGYYGEKTLWIEFKRTHEVDVHKAGKIISARINCIEIDLNSCGQDKEKLREFITQSFENRKWIYSREHGVGSSEHTVSNRNSSPKVDSELGLVKLDRHFAIDDKGKLIDFREPSEFDANKHSYYCPCCGKEVVLKVDDNGSYTFDHIEETNICKDEMYLRSAAVSAIQKAFENSKSFIIHLPQYRSCKNDNKCSYYQECQIPTTQQYDLKSHHFDKYTKDYKFNDVAYSTDLVLYRENIQKNSIEVRVNTENLEYGQNSPRRTIDITIYNENDVHQLKKGLSDYKNVHFTNFAPYAEKKAEPTEINHNIWKFIIYTSGKIYIGPARCTELSNSFNNSNTIKEGAFIRTNNIKEDMYIFLLLYYKKLQKDICRCQLCWSLKKTNGINNNYICTRYKTKGTPKHPLQEKNPPKECPYFKADFNILKREKELIEKMKIVEFQNIPQNK